MRKIYIANSYRDVTLHIYETVGASASIRCAKVSGFVNKRVRSDKNIGRARGTLPALAGSTVSWEDSFRFSVITANSLSQPRCAPSRVSVFYPEFGPRVPDDHPPASPPAFVAAARCPRCWGSSSTSIVRSSKEVPASSGKVCTPISPAIREKKWRPVSKECDRHNFRSTFPLRGNAFPGEVRLKDALRVVD